MTALLPQSRTTFVLGIVSCQGEPENAEIALNGINRQMERRKACLQVKGLPSRLTALVPVTNFPGVRPVSASSTT
ncbi:MAG: hypothetical protein JWO82_1015 [Akkermansiaceae bacterium]|nr:hypothetical protein [Akkermansiaceae bacterium]